MVAQFGKLSFSAYLSRPIFLNFYINSYFEVFRLDFLDLACFCEELGLLLNIAGKHDLMECGFQLGS